VAEVHAFEPVPLIRERLLHNLKLNGADRVHVHGQAVGAHESSALINVPLQDFPSDASMLSRTWVETHPVRVDVTTLDAFARTANLTSVQVIKIDTEGTEHEVIEGGAWLVGRDRPVIIAEVLHRLPAEQKLGPLLAGLGYRAWHMTPLGLRPVEVVTGDPLYRDLNYLFIHSEKSVEVLADLRKSIPVLSRSRDREV
jgi:FkbM family methyltransferase